ncbi:hypothetical protein SMC26_18670 [Actinomadura fulvescens]|uniref:Uncharacterized protein n=1 Tax=Actinomadura fulvescens TaxID=46160 RepID=A0ABN3QFF4_9ACTN
MKRSFAVVATTAIVGALGVPMSGAPASAQSTVLACEEWQDRNTYGANCSGSKRWYQAMAKCNNGSYAHGSINYNGWSYAYCANLGGLDYGYYRWR